MSRSKRSVFERLEDRRLLAAVIKTFQENINGYTGTQDTYLRQAAPASSLGTSAIVNVDLDDDSGVSGNQQAQGLVRFDNLFGPGANQVPVGATITSATLTFINSNGSTQASRLHRMLVNWNESSTWNSLTAGITANGVEAASAFDASVTPTNVGAQANLNVTATLQQWANNPSSNFGWVLIATGSNGWDLHSSEAGTASNRPVLSITYDDNSQPPQNQAPSVNAGSDQPITLPASANLDGTVSDDGLPSGTLATTWTKFSGPGTVTFGNANAVDTTGSFSLAGTYVLRLTANDGSLQTSDDVTITVNPQSPSNQPPQVNAGLDATLTLPSSASLDGAVTDDGLPSNTLTTTWTKFSGPGTVTFGNANAVDTTASFSLAGTYVLRLTASDGSLQSTDDVQITVNPASGSPQTRTFREGVGGYVGTQDTFLRQAAAGSSFGTSTLLNVDLDDDNGASGNQQAHALVRFDNLFGSGPNQIPLGASITSATLTFVTTNGSTQATRLHRMLVNWTEASTWNSLTAGVSANGVEAVSAFDASVVPPSTGVTNINVTASLQAWASNPANNLGWALLPTGTNGWDFDSSEIGTITNRPLLSITYTGGAQPTNQAPGANAGGDQTISLPSSASLDGTVSDDGLPSGTLTTTWTKFSGPGTVTFGNANAVDTTASFSLAGTYLLRLTASDGSLQTSDDVQIIVNPQNQPPSVDAGSNQTISLPSGASLDGTVSDDGLPSGTLTTTWTKFSGPGTVTFGNLNAVDTTASFSLAGTYVLRLTANDGSLQTNDDVTIIVNPQNQAPTVEAGSNQTISLPNSAALDGTVSDDGLPSGTLTTAWTKFSGPGDVTFGNANDVDTSASFSLAGAYVLRLTANDGALQTSDDVTITVDPQNAAPQVNAGGDQTVTLPNFANLDGTVSDDGLPSNTLTTTWTKFSGPGTVTFGNANDVDTTAAFSVDGTYVLRLTGNDGSLQTTDDVTVTVNPQPAQNQQPSVHAGGDQTITLPDSATLDGTAADDGLPSATLTTTWSKFSGPGVVTFGNVNAVDTTTSFSIHGTYVLRLTADDGALQSTDDATITVNSEASPNQAPTVDAGQAQTITLPSSASLDGAVSDDGLPSSTLTTTWSKFSGPGGSDSVTFGNANSVDTTASFTVDGTYVLRLTANDGSIETFDDVTITVNPQGPSNQAPQVNAGNDQTITLPSSASLDGTVSDDGLPSNSLTTTWTKFSGPGTVTFGDANAVDTAASFSEAGTYVLRLTASDGSLETIDDVTITVNPAAVNQAPSTSAGFDRWVTTPNAASLDGTVTDDGLPTNTLTTIWTQISGPGTASFGNANAIDTTATFSAAGVYVLRLTANDGSLQSFDEVQVTVSPSITAGLAGHWQFNEASGTTAADSSGNGNTGTLTNGPLFVAGQTGNALSFDGVDDRVVIPDSASLDVTNQITLSAWIRPGRVATQYLIKKSRIDATDGYELSLSNGGLMFVRFNQFTSADAFRLNSTTVHPSNGTTWMHVAATYDGATIKLYLNGTLHAQLAAVFTIAANNVAVGIGAEDAGLRPYLGAIDDARIYNRALSDAEISQLLTPPPANNPPTVNAGNDQAITLPALANLDGTVTDDGQPNPPAAVQSLWTKVSGPGNVTFGNAGSVDTTASFSTAGTFVLRLSGSDGTVTISDEVTINVNGSGGSNQPPSASAGNDSTVTLPNNSVNLDGTVTDDGLPSGNVTSTWTKFSGPGEANSVTFGNANAVDTTASFSQAGTYVLRLTANDGQFQISDDVTIVVNPQPVASVQPITQMQLSATTGEKPMSKVWKHDGKWWAVLPINTGTWVWELVGTTWVSRLQLSASTNFRADVKPLGNLAHILLFAGASGSQLASIEYVAGAWQRWSQRLTDTPVSLTSGVEAATIDIDGNGRLWIASDAVTTVEVRYTDGNYSTINGPITLGNMNTDDISSVIAFPDGSVGVLWSNQNTERYGFRKHDGSLDANAWGADEVPASQSAQDIGAGMADDHVNLKMGSDGTLYAGVKTGFNTTGQPQLILLVRRPNGQWDNLYQVDTTGTRQVVVLNEVEGTITMFYVDGTQNNPIVYRKSSLSSISFGPRQTLISGTWNSPSSTKQNITSDLVVIASSSTNVMSGAYVTTGVAAPDTVSLANVQFNRKKSIAFDELMEFSDVVS